MNKFIVALLFFCYPCFAQEFLQTVIDQQKINGRPVLGSHVRTVIFNGKTVFHENTTVDVPEIVAEFPSNIAAILDSYPSRTSYLETYYVIDGQPIPSIVVHFMEHGHVHANVVNAQTGQILLKLATVFNCINDINNRPHLLAVVEDSPFPGNPHPTGLQSVWQQNTIYPQQLMRNDINQASPQGWIFPSAPLATIGNNALALYTIQGQTATGQTVTVNTGSNFEYVFNPLLSSQENIKAGVVNLFYQANYFHDLMYINGFDESHGNFQFTNYTGQGAAQDYLIVLCTIGFGTNNAQFSGTNWDGTPAIIEMKPFINASSGVDRHSAFENLIVFHELFHGVTMRQILGVYSSTNYIYASLHEGFSDAASLIILSENYNLDNTSNLRLKTFSMVSWASYDMLNIGFLENYYSGVRRYPYSYDMNKNPLTFGDMSPFLLNLPSSSVVPISRLPIPTFGAHSFGEILAVTFWDCFILLTERYGAEEARNRMLKMFVRGQQLTISNPHYPDVRDGFLRAGEVFYNNEDRTLLWFAFARRGLGVGASYLQSSSYFNIVEDFNIPNWGDHNQDQEINDEDFKDFIQDYTAGSYICDINCDNKVSDSDFLMFMKLWSEH